MAGELRKVPAELQATGILTTTVDGSAAVSSDGAVLQNTTAATGSVTAQISPRLRLRGTAWDTAASKNVDWWIEQLPVTLSTPYSNLKFGFQVEGGAASYPFAFSSSGQLTVGSLGVTGLASSGSTRMLTAGTATAGTGAADERMGKTFAAIGNGVATPTVTVTVPNAAHSATVRVTVRGSLGAGGAIGANEATASITYDFAVARTAGVATVVGASAAYGSATAAVAGAATITLTAAASVIAGAVSATQTFTINVTITRGSGSSDNHTCQVVAEVINANNTGITVA